MTAYSKRHENAVAVRKGSEINVEITRIEKVNLVDEVFRQLREMILSGTWAEGTKIDSENELARRFSVSRVVIREALQLLRSEKLIVTRQGVGTYVANPSNFGPVDRPIDLTEAVYRQFLEFRNSVEVSAIELSKTKATEQDFDRIADCLEEMRQFEDDNEHYSTADFNYHLAVVRCAHNSFLERAMLANRNAVTSVLLEMNAVPKSQRFGVNTHQFIYEAIKRRDTKAVISKYNEMGKYNLTRLATFFHPVARKKE